MAFATDRDLIVLEPGLHNDVAWTAQRLVSVNDASITNNALTTSKADFEQSGVDAGHIAVIAGVTLEVVERLGPGTLLVSMVRADASGEALPTLPSLSGTLTIHTFAPQIELTHRELLRRAGVAPAGEPNDTGAISEEMIIGGASLRSVEALGALRLVFSSAAARPDDRAWRKAEMYRARFERAARRARIEIDRDGDGDVDEARRIGAGYFAREGS